MIFLLQSFYFEIITCGYNIYQSNTEYFKKK